MGCFDMGIGIVATVIIEHDMVKLKLGLATRLERLLLSHLEAGQTGHEVTWLVLDTEYT